MKFSISCLLLILSSILLLSQQSNARKDLGGYWKSVMNDQPIPEAIRDLYFHQDHEDHLPSLPGSREKDHFVRDFDIRPNAIIYHGAHHHHQQQQQPAEDKPMHDMEPKEETSYIETVTHG
ncbi:hypothetical protein ACE6H2_027045 [Prunus campanulata]